MKRRGLLSALGFMASAAAVPAATVAMASSPKAPERRLLRTFDAANLDPRFVISVTVNDRHRPNCFLIEEYSDGTVEVVRLMEDSDTDSSRWFVFRHAMCVREVGRGSIAIDRREPVPRRTYVLDTKYIEMPPLPSLTKIEAESRYGRIWSAREKGSNIGVAVADGLSKQGKVL